VNKNRIKPAKAAEQEANRKTLAPNPAAEQSWDEIPELDPVDQYVIAHGEYPLSGDIVGPDVADDTLLEAITLPDDRPAERPEAA
jgi:hypothetical protein